MKKFLKTLLIVVLLCGAIGGTTYFFFSHLREPVDYFQVLSAYTTSADNAEFEGKLASIAKFTSKSSDDRFEVITNTNSSLNSINNTLASYLITAEEHNYNTKHLEKSFNELKNSKGEVDATMNEYLAKVIGQLNPSLGANDVYCAFAKYFVNYSAFLKGLSADLDRFNLNKDADLKFALIDVYLNVASNTFANITVANNLNKVSNSDNITLINKCFKLENSFITTKAPNGNFSYLNNNFVKNYNECNKLAFAEQLKALTDKVNKDLTNVNSSNYSKEELCAVYFKNIFEV